jgi:uncharacterized protein (DUF924 family)
MTQIQPADVTPQDILEFWFPNDLLELDDDKNTAFWRSRMMGGMDDAICERYETVAVAGARGDLDDWAQTPMGRLALILVLDQFPRSLWRDTPAAFGQDIKSCRLALEGITNGHYDALDYPWQKNFYFICIGHCEGPDHLDRINLMIRKTDELRDSLTGRMAELYPNLGKQPRRVYDIIARFGRHPHRNPIYGRVSTPDEEAYIAEGDFPHAPKELK